MKIESIRWGFYVRQTRKVWILVSFVFCYYGFFHGFELFNDLNSQIPSPYKSPSYKATKAFLHLFPNQLINAFPSSTVVYLKAEEVEEMVFLEKLEKFERYIIQNLYCENLRSCERMESPSYLGFAKRFVGFTYDTEEKDLMTSKFQKKRFLKPNYAEVVIEHNIGYRKASMMQFFEALEEILEECRISEDFLGESRKEKFLTGYASEIKMLDVAKRATVYDFEHADMIGIPFAWAILFITCGLPSVVLLLTLPSSILFSFYICLLVLDDDLPQFAPSLLVSISVALNIDYALFFLARYRNEMMRSLALNCREDPHHLSSRSLNSDSRTEIVNQALDEALLSSGKTIMISGTIFLLTTLSLSFVPAQTISSLGKGLFLTNMVTIVVNITILPALTHCFAFTWLDHLDFSLLKNLSTGCKRSYLMMTGRYFSTEEQLQKESENYKQFHALLEEDQNAADFAESRVHVSQIRDKLAMDTTFTDSRAHVVGSMISRTLQLCTRTSRESLDMDSELEDELFGSRPKLNTTVTSVVSHSSQKFENNQSLQVKVVSLTSRFPNSIIYFCIMLLLPSFWNLFYLKTSDDQNYLVPMKDKFVESSRPIYEERLNVGSLADYKMILAANFDERYFNEDLPTPEMSIKNQLVNFLNSSSAPEVSVGSREKSSSSDIECFDDNVFVYRMGLEVGFEHLSCSLLSVLFPGCIWHPSGTIDQSAGSFALQILKNICPKSCDSCTPELATSEAFFEIMAEVTDDFLQLVKYNNFSTQEAFFLQNPSYFLGQKVSFLEAKTFIQDNYKTENSEFGILYQKMFYESMPVNHTAVLTPLFPNIDPFGGLAHAFVSLLRDEGTIEVFTGDVTYSVFVGGTVTALFDQVDSVYRTGPLVIGITVVLTIFGTSYLVFKSVVLGPRLLFTILYTVFMVFGASVHFYQCGEDSKADVCEGLYWIVPVVGLPVVVGCTLDYDSYLVARIYDFRVAGFTTKKAIVQGFADTAHIITLAGLIMVIAFGSMLFSSVTAINQVGFVLVLCALVDTFLVRMLLVPSLMFIADENNWYPADLPEPNED